MLSNIWNQITQVESDSSDDESPFPAKTDHLQEDDIFAASLLTSFPTYGSHRKALALESPTLNPTNAQTSISSIVSGDWDMSPAMGRVKKTTDGLGVGGLFTFDDLVSSGDDADDNGSIISAPITGAPEQKKGTGTVAENHVGADLWSDEESNLWRDSKKIRRKRARKSRSLKKDLDTNVNGRNAEANDLKRQWIHGSSLTTHPSSVASPTSSKELSRRPYRKPHYINNDDVTTGTDFTSSDEEESASDPIKVDEKFQSHWMPDQLCRTCYACGTQFTVFRRRHHCRLCGQVFCNRCSSFFVEIVAGVMNNQLQQHPDVKTIRTCKMCYEQVSASGPNGLSLYNSNTGQEIKQKILTGPGNSDMKDKEQPEGNIPSFSQVEDGGPPREIDSFQGGSSSDFSNLALVKQKLEEERVKNENEEQEAAGDEKSGKAKIPIKSLSSTFKGRFGRLAESAAREAQVGDAGYNDEDTNLIGTGVRNKDEDEAIVPPSPEYTLGNSSNTVLPAKDDVDNQKQYAEAIKEGNRQLRMTAADYLEKMGRELLRTDAPTLLIELGMEEGYGPTFNKWISKLMTLSTKCCKSVKVDIRNGDGLDIRPYCKVKAIPGGKLKDSAFVSGVVFHKNVSHKAMAREIKNPRIMLLSGGIDYTRAEHRIASLNTLLEQEEKYLQILIAKITKLKPNILMVSRAVSRKAQELLLETNIILLQYVKPALMDSIARQTGATILSSTDHVMNQFGANVLGKCRRFRLVSFRDNDVWNSKDNSQDGDDELAKVRALISNIDDQKDVEAFLATVKLRSNQRQAILAAHLLGERVHDGSKAVRSGIQKRGVTQTYVMIEGCPSNLGCTIILRGATRPALKEVKRILKFLINVAYNLKLETSYLEGRHAMLPKDYQISMGPAMSSSLCVEYGQPPPGRKTIRPWNGGNTDSTHWSLSGKITALEHQSILISSVWMAGKTQCCPAEVKGICYYSEKDVSLGQFLRDSCFNLTLKCQNPNCKKTVIEHSLSFVHNDGLINITVEEMDGPIPVAEHPKEATERVDINDKDKDRYATWAYCMNCRKVVTPLSYISDETWRYSFGKFLEMSFYNKTVTINAPEHQCHCQLQGQTTLYFGCGNLAARFTYARIRPYNVFFRRYLPFDEAFHKKFTVLELNEIMVSSSDLFERFHTHIETATSDTRTLFVSAVNKPEHLQTLLSELYTIGQEVAHASNILKSKIVSVTNKYNTYNQDAESGYSCGEVGSAAHDAFSYFPWHARRYLFLLTSAWNERLGAIVQAVSSMKKVVAVSQKLSIGGRSDIGIPQGVGADGELDEVMESMQRLKEIKDVYANFNIGDMDIQSRLGSLPDKRAQKVNDDIEDDDFNSELAGSAYDDIQINFSEEVDADVMASRRRRSVKQIEPNSSRSIKKGSDDDNERRRRKNKPPSRPSKESGSYNPQFGSRDSFVSISSRSPSPSPQQRAKAVSAGGAVKSAINRFFNRGGKEEDTNTVDLGIFNQGRPRLEPGVGGVVIPVFDDQPSTIIAHSLASVDYESQFRRHTRTHLKEIGSIKRGTSSGPHERDEFLDGRGIDQQTSKKYDARSGRRGRSEQRRNKNRTTSSTPQMTNTKADIEKRMLVRNKTHVKHTFRDFDEKGTQIAKFICTTFWATQFQAVRQAFLKEKESDKAPGFTYGKNFIEKNFVKSLSASLSFAAVGGKSGASFSKTADDRFIVKSISRTELQMFLDCAPAYFEYLSKAFFHGLPTMLCKIVGVYQIGYHNRETGKRTMEQVVIMQNIFYGRNVSKVFDLKGSLRGRFAKNLRHNKEKAESRASPSPASIPKRYGSDSDVSSDDDADYHASYTGSDDEEGAKDEESKSSSTLLDGDFLDFTSGRPLPLTDRAKANFHMSILNDTLFLSIINVLDYSILVGIDEEKNELVVGIIDFMRQYDILKQMERVGKSIPMVVGSEAPTIIQPPAYKTRFITAMERYFMTVPNKWTTL